MCYSGYYAIQWELTTSEFSFLFVSDGLSVICHLKFYVSNKNNNVKTEPICRFEKIKVALVRNWAVSQTQLCFHKTASVLPCLVYTTAVNCRTLFLVVFYFSGDWTGCPPPSKSYRSDFSKNNIHVLVQLKVYWFRCFHY